jgi:hypothetical protein
MSTPTSWTAIREVDQRFELLLAPEDFEVVQKNECSEGMDNECLKGTDSTQCFKIGYGQYLKKAPNRIQVKYCFSQMFRKVDSDSQVC